MKQWFKSIWEDGDKFQLGLTLVLANGAGAILTHYQEPIWLIAGAWALLNISALKTNVKSERLMRNHKLPK